MLCQFTVENFKSIKDPITLNLTAANITEHSDKIIIGSDGQKFLPLSVIYGPNGAGKSNILEAIYCCHYKIMLPIFVALNHSVRPFFHEIAPFKFSDDSINSPTMFEIFFRTASSEYKYNLSLKQNNVVFESLSKMDLLTNARSDLFVYDTEVKFFNELKDIRITDLSQSLTVLSHLGMNYGKNHIVNDVISWFNDLQLRNYGEFFFEREIPAQRDEDLIKMLNEMDINICDYRIENNDNRLNVFTDHRINNSVFTLNLLEESAGTKKLFGILPRVLRSIVRGTPFIADEIDAKLHPALLGYIIDLYRNPNINIKGAQLIFTSHELSTMCSRYFRRDEIWFAAKNADQSTGLYSLVEFKKDNGKSPRKDEVYGKQYMEGRYGADPYLQRIINW